MTNKERLDANNAKIDELTKLVKTKASGGVSKTMLFANDVLDGSASISIPSMTSATVSFSWLTQPFGNDMSLINTTKNSINLLAWNIVVGNYTMSIRAQASTNPNYPHYTTSGNSSRLGMVIVQAKTSTSTTSSMIFYVTALTITPGSDGYSGTANFVLEPLTEYTGFVPVETNTNMDWVLLQQE